MEGSQAFGCLLPCVDFTPWGILPTFSQSRGVRCAGDARPLLLVSGGGDVELESERLERSQLENLSTAELVRHALAETKLLVKAEVLHAKKELREEVKAARTSGILLGIGLTLALCGLAVLFVAVGLALPLRAWLGVLLVGVAIVLIAGGLAWFGVKRLPKKPLAHTQGRLKTDFDLARETLQ